MKSFLKSKFPTTVNWLKTRPHFWKAYYFTGELELLELSRYIDPHRTSIDVGANIGTYSYHMSRLSRHVVAFEPNPAYSQRLRALNLKSLTIEEVALSSENGSATLQIPRTDSNSEDAGMASIQKGVVSAGSLANSFEVKTDILDNYLFKNVGFIKIDVEGHEENVLAGAQKTIADNLPVLLIEIEERHNPGGLHRIATNLAKLNYDGCFIYEGSHRLIREFNAQHHQSLDAVTGSNSNRRKLQYVNNFVFAPRDRIAGWLSS